MVAGFGDPVNMHDILTGSKPDGTLATPAQAGGDTTCGNWTKSVDGSATVGHHDKKGTNPDPVATWREAPIVCNLRRGRHELRMWRGAQLVYRESFRVRPGEDVVLTAWDPPPLPARIKRSVMTGLE